MIGSIRHCVYLRSQVIALSCPLFAIILNHHVARPTIQSGSSLQTLTNKKKINKNRKTTISIESQSLPPYLTPPSPVNNKNDSTATESGECRSGIIQLATTLPPHCSVVSNGLFFRLLTESEPSLLSSPSMRRLW